MSQRSRPTISFWVAIALVAMLVYPLSFGPACWLSSRTGFARTAIPRFYQPIIGTFLGGEPSPVGKALLWYGNAYAARDWVWLPAPPDVNPGGNQNADLKWEWVYWPANPPP